MANRAVLARRAAQNSALPSKQPRASRSTGTDPAARAITIVTETGHVKRSSAMKMTGAQRNSEGRMSEWNDSTEFFTCPKWGSTVSTHP